MSKQLFLTALVASFMGSVPANADDALNTLKSMTGCYVVDYSYVETEVLKPGYVRDGRVYDVNKGKTVKEWIYPIISSPTKVRLQHLMFIVDADGSVSEDSMLKHTGEDWELDADYRYDFQGPMSWIPVAVPKGQGIWTRRVTHLDDGLRYQCSAPWTDFAGGKEWKCAGAYAPIPGRETRDMKRRDYQTLMRDTRLVAYGSGWLERQENTKTVHATDGTRTPLVRELGKNWYVPIADQECEPARKFAAPRMAYWDLVRETWDMIFAENKPFTEVTPAGEPPRYFALGEIEDKVLSQGLDVRSPAVRNQIQSEVLGVIRAYRAP